MKKTCFCKRFILLFICLVFFAAGSIPVYADMMWEPDSNAFYSAHSKDCYGMSKICIANGSEGYITGWESPDSNKKIASFTNGTKFHIFCAYTDDNGENWGLSNFEKSEDKYISFWINMKDLTGTYDSDSFYLEHQSEFHPYAGDLNEYTVKSALILWTYPGSGNHTVYTDKQMPVISYTYTDDSGSKWGCVTNRKQWICINDPENSQIPAKAVKTDVIIPPSPSITVWYSNSPEEVILLAASIIAAAAVTAVLIRVFWKKKKSSGL